MENTVGVDKTVRAVGRRVRNHLPLRLPRQADRQHRHRRDTGTNTVSLFLICLLPFTLLKGLRAKFRYFMGRCMGPPRVRK